MLYTELTKKAMKISFEAHKEQVDKNGLPYIYHPIHLAEQMESEDEICVALLHDVVEDTEVTLEDLRKEFPSEVVEAVALLTHDKTVNYFEYVKEIKKNPIARNVKIADLEHNSDESRSSGSEHTEERLAYWRTKYSKAKAKQSMHRLSRIIPITADLRCGTTARVL